MPKGHKIKGFIHHQEDGANTATIRETIFGSEDGMVSTLGSVTGIAAATADPYTVLLAGCVIISVESISMAVGSYLSSKSERAIDERKLLEEKIELQDYPEEEKEELIGMYIADGWSRALAKDMAEEASKNKALFLQEMAYRELKVFPEDMENPTKNAVAMGISYIIGGSIPVLPYIFLPPSIQTIWLSVGLTLFFLFLLGAVVTKYTKRNWVKSGLEMLVLAGVAAAIGYVVGQLITVVV